MPVPHWSELEAFNQQLSSLEDLARLSDNYGLVEVKPFKDWRVSPYRNKVFSMRLCNAGEILEITSYCDGIPQTARTQATRIELLIRSVWAIDSRRLMSDEEMADYNKAHASNLKVVDYLRLWMRNVEQLVIDRLEAVYGGLQLKQMRAIQGLALCEVCQTNFTDIPEGSRYLKYSLGEIICPTCQSVTDLTAYDFQESTDVKPPVASQPTASRPEVAPEERSFGGNGYVCECKEEFDSLEDFTTHRESCPEAARIPAS